MNSINEIKYRNTKFKLLIYVFIWILLCVCGYLSKLYLSTFVWYSWEPVYPYLHLLKENLAAIMLGIFALGIFAILWHDYRQMKNLVTKEREAALKLAAQSEQRKNDLVVYLAHDLKTPLTAIITYINLLKEGGLTEQQRREYIATLERKSLRLKSLIEDLFEFSKASSHNITLNIMDVDIMNLIKQVAFEMSDKLGETGLDVRMNLTEEKVILPLDSQKTYRIYENLFGNIAKYALPGTRVYVNGFRIDDMVVITLKNISAQEITVDSSELTERFVRGDASRNTEGSGLGLAIAKSFTELQGGLLELEVDGDLFKIILMWKCE